MKPNYINDLPAPTPDDEFVIGIVPRPWIRYVIGALEQRKAHWLYESSAEAKIAYNIISEVQLSFLINAYNGLTEPVDRVYRLLDTVLNGATYTSAIVDDVVVISPAIPVVPVLSIESIIVRLNDLIDIVNDALNGSVAYDPTSLRDGVRDVLEAIRDNVVADDADITAILDDLGTILALLA